MNDQDLLKEVSQILLAPADLNQRALESVLSKTLSSSIDMSEIFLQRTESEAWMLEDGVVRDADYSIDQGFGLRVTSGEKIGFAYADAISLPELTTAASSACSIVQSGRSGTIALPPQQSVIALYSDLNPLVSLDDTDKVALLTRLDKEIRSRDPRITNVILRLSSSHDVVLVLQGDGGYAADIRPMVSFNMSIIVDDNGRRESASAGGGARDGYQFFTEERLQGYINKALHQVQVNLDARPAPAGEMPVVLGTGWAAVILHEAIGHGLEGDFNRKGSSAFSGRIGEHVADEQCTIVDDGTLERRRGSLTVDDEGTPSQCTTLIENGILKGYMHDRHNARLMGVKPTGNGRRESYAHQTIPRMTNTYMLAGKYERNEIIESVENGIYAVDFSGGQVDITSGKFVFTTSEAYMIENGKISYPVKNVTLIGDGPEVLTQVSMVGNDLELDQGIGVCGKDGQSVPVGVGQPTLKVNKLVVGGTGSE
jgi:TldD protein